MAIMVYAFTSGTSLENSYSQRQINTKINEFNVKFTKYNISKEEVTNKNYVSIHNIVTLANYANEFNEGMEKNANDYISVFLENEDITGNSKNYNDIIRDNLTTEDGKEKKKYYCANIEFNSTTGRIKSITFKAVKK